MTKKLYMMVQDCGDGSYSILFTLDGEWITRQQERYDNGEICGPDDAGCDGDGFSYKSINVPDDATYESLGISQWSVAENDD